MPVWGWDASNHDWGRGGMDLEAARAAGIDFFVHKCTDGPGYYKDPYFAQAMARARNADFPLTGAYHVLWNGHVEEQMDWFMSVLDEAAPWWRTEPYLLQLDCEPFGYNGSTPTKATIQQAADCLVAETGGRCRPVVYAPKWVYENQLAGLGHPLWASNYGTNAIAAHTVGYPGDGSTRWAAYSGQVPAILQYSSRAQIGSQSQCDANAYRGTLAELRALISGGDDMSAEAEDTLRALREGTPQAAGGVFAPWQWQTQNDKAFDAIIKRLGELAAKPAGGLTAEDRAAIVAELKGEIPTAGQIAAELINQLRAT